MVRHLIPAAHCCHPKEIDRPPFTTPRTLSVNTQLFSAAFLFLSSASRPTSTQADIARRTSRFVEHRHYLMRPRLSARIRGLAPEINDDNATVLGPIPVFWICRFRRALSDGLEPGGRHPHLLYEVVFDCFRTAIRQHGVVFVPARPVRVSFDQEELLILELVVERIPEIAQRLNRLRFEPGRGKFELYGVK